MKKSLSTLLFLFLICTAGMSQTGKFDFSYAVFFGGGFENDTVSIKVNNVQLGSQYVVTSSKMIQRANLRFRQTAKGIVLLYNGKETIKPKIKHGSSLLIELIVNGSTTKQQVNLSQGQIFLINYSSQLDNRSNRQKVTIEQHKDALITM